MTFETHTKKRGGGAPFHIAHASSPPPPPLYTLSTTVAVIAAVSTTSTASLNNDRPRPSQLAPLPNSLPNSFITTRASAVSVDGGVAECSTEVEEEEPSMATQLMNSSFEFNPFVPMSTLLYQTASFKQPSAVENGPYDYIRDENPTRSVLENLLAKLEKADRPLCFKSGMAALTAVTRLVGTGQEIVVGDDIYGGSDRLLSEVLPKSGIVVKRVNMCDLEEVASAIRPWTKHVWVESPINPRQQICDIRKVAEMAHAHGALLLVDNSIMSPVLCRPLELGADIAVTSTTKFIAGQK